MRVYKSDACATLHVHTKLSSNRGTNMKVIILAAILVVKGAVSGVVPVSPYGYSAPFYGGHAISAPLVARPALAAPYAVARPALAAPVYGHAVAKIAAPEEYDPNPQYSYSYDIQDALTGDSKNQQESRSGDVVQGSYSLTDPDGTRRTVEYTADPHNGFNAVVHKEPLGVAKVVAAPHAILH